MTKSVAEQFKIMSFDALPSRGAGGPQSKYPFADTNPGEYFVIPDTERKGDTASDLSKKVSTLASQAGKKLERKFAVRSIVEDDKPFVGVYCLKPENDEAEAEV